VRARVWRSERACGVIRLKGEHGMSDLIRAWIQAAKVAAILVVAALIAAPPASAQTLYGSITGAVTDQSGAPVPGATVVATNAATALKGEATTDATGHYTIRNLV